MKKTIMCTVVSILLCGAGGFLFSQSNEIIDQLLDEEKASLGKTAYLVFVAAGIAGEDWSVDEAFGELQSRGWGFESSSPDDPVSLGAFALLVMRSYGMKGGILYAIIPGRRYAAREFAYRKFVPGDTSPYRKLSGQDVTHILGKVLEFLGEREV